jgi:hypothetical protein
VSIPKNSQLSIAIITVIGASIELPLDAASADIITPSDKDIRE